MSKDNASEGVNIGRGVVEKADAHQKLIGETEFRVPDQDPARGNCQSRYEESYPEQQFREAGLRACRCAR